jgi:hypothetical protein
MTSACQAGHILVLLPDKQLYHRRPWRCRSPADVAHPCPLENLDTANYSEGLLWAVGKGECDGGSGFTKATGQASREREIS